MENNELLLLLKEYIVESKEADVLNTKEHKEINACVNSLKIKMGKVETLCESSNTARETCFKHQADIESRMREAEKIIHAVKDLPEKFDKLAVKVYGITGAMTLVMLLAGWMLRNSILAGVQ